MNTRVTSIKRAQKEAEITRIIAELLRQSSQEDSKLTEVCISRSELSANKSLCVIYFYTTQGEASFNALREHLILYKPSVRKVLAQRMPSRYVPDIRFAYDARLEKQSRIETLIAQVSRDLPPSE